MFLFNNVQSQVSILYNILQCTASFVIPLYDVCNYLMALDHAFLINKIEIIPLLTFLFHHIDLKYRTLNIVHILKSMCRNVMVFIVMHC